MTHGLNEAAGQSSLLAEAAVALSEGPDTSTDVRVHVVPRASKSAFVGVFDERIKVQIAAPPVDGAANEALRRLFADGLALPLRDVDVVHGDKQRRKTVRVALNMAEVRKRLGALVLALGLCSLGCEVVTDTIAVKVVLPVERTQYAAVDNASLVYAPDGFEESFAIDGLDFSLSVELAPDDTSRALSLYLAEGTDLVAWGRTPHFSMNTAPSDLAVFVAAPGRVSTLGSSPALTADVMAAPALGRGALVLESDGGGWFLNTSTWAIDRSSSLGSILEAEALPAASDGTLVADALGGVIRITWNDALAAWRYDPGDDAWIALTLREQATFGPRGAAAFLPDDAHEQLFLLGGSDTRVLAIDLVPDDGRLEVRTVDNLVLDAPRPGASARWVRYENASDDTAIIVGTQAALPVVFDAASGMTAGPMGPWTDLRCAQLDHEPSANSTVRLLCGGGSKDDVATADAFIVRILPAATGSAAIEVESLEQFFPAPLASPLWFSDRSAVYAQGDARFFAIDSETLEISEPNVQSHRVRGGVSVTLATGVSLLVGGLATDQQAVEHWQVFVPTP